MITEAGRAAAGDSRRGDIDDCQGWLAAQPRGGGPAITAQAHRQRMRAVRQFCGGGSPGGTGPAPRNPVIGWDMPQKPGPPPKFPADRAAAAPRAAARAGTGPRGRLVAGLLARTGMRAGVLADLGAGAVVRIGTGHRPPIPLGQLRTGCSVSSILAATKLGADREGIRAERRPAEFS